MTMFVSFVEMLLTSISEILMLEPLKWVVAIVILSMLLSLIIRIFNFGK